MRQGQALRAALAAAGKAVHPNGLYPAADGSLLMGGFKSDTEARGICKLMPGAEPRALAEGTGRVDGTYQAKDGGLLC